MIEINLADVIENMPMYIVVLKKKYFRIWTPVSIYDVFIDIVSAWNQIEKLYYSFIEYLLKNNFVIEETNIGNKAVSLSYRSDDFYFDEDLCFEIIERPIRKDV